MTGTPGAAATRDGEAPERSPPCSPSYDLTGKVGGHCAQRWGLLCRPWGSPLPRFLCPQSPDLPAQASYWLRLPWTHLFPPHPPPPEQPGLPE